MKAIIYYSLSGKTHKEVTERYKGDFFRLKGKIKIPKKYWMQLVYLGMFATLNSKLKYKEIDFDADKYDEIVLASPVWAWTVAPFIKKFMINNRFKNKKVTLLVTHEGGPGKVMKRFKRFLDKSNEIVEELELMQGTAYQNATIIKN